MLFLLIISGNIQAQGISGETLANLTDVQKYYRAIHVMAMLLFGFGFLMVFVRKYGRSALTATFLLVSISIPLYYFISDFGINLLCLRFYQWFRNHGFSSGYWLRALSN